MNASDIPVVEFEYAGLPVRMAVLAGADHISSRISATHTFYEVEFLEALKEFVIPGDLVLDLGANIGNHTVYFAGIAGCKVMAFEPVASTCDVLRRNVELNGLQQTVEVFQIAVGDQSGAASVALFDDKNVGATRLRMDGGGEIEVTTVDRLNFPQSVRLIKIDVEGMDVAVVRGALETLGKHRPILACEAATSAEFAELVNVLAGLGYVAVACFNATDTYIFLPAGQTEEDQLVTRYGFKEIIALQKEARRLNGRFAELGRYAERVSKEQHERAVGRAESLMSDLAAKSAEVLAGAVQGLERRIAVSNAAVLDAISAKDHAAEAMEAMRAAKQQSEAETRRLRERLQGELSEKTRWKQAAAQSTESARSSAAQAEIYARSITFQLGSAMQASLSSPVGIIKLPIRIYRILREWRRRRGSQADALSDWRVVVPVRLPDAIIASTARVSRGAAIAQMPAAPEQTTHAVATDGMPGQLNPISRAVIPRLPSLPKHADELRVAAIMDEFTFGSYGPCCDVQQLLPSSWREQLEAQSPHLLFIESAWQGKNGAWEGKVVHSSPELEGILAWCRERRIPTIFWNKEDPVHFETFVGFAQRFDHVFTTDIDCIGRYKAALGHDRVYLLPFACQPLHHNPIEKYQRKNAFCFAGAYYARYPERQKDFDVFIDSLTTLAPVEIYDRNFGKDHPDYMFPERYKELILGNLPFDQIDVAYKGYAYAINLNSVKQSQTMFARRAFDLLGCNTLTVSNYSRGLRLMFGDLVVTTDSGAQLVRRLQTLLGESNESRYRKFRLAGLRKILREHTYADRLSYILGKVAGRASSKRLPGVVVVARIENDQQLDQVLNSFDKQQYVRRALVLVTSDGYVLARELDRPDVSLMPASKAKETDPSLAWPGDFVSVFAVEDYYGSHYLNDLALSTLYSGTRAVGKGAYFTSENGAASLRNDGAQYRSCSTLQARRALIGSELLGGNLAALLGDGGGTEVYDATALAIDEFNYVEYGASSSTWSAADDLDDLDSGLSMSELHARAEAIEPQVFEPRDGTRTVSGDDLISLFGAPRKEGDVRLEGDGLGFVLASTLAYDKHHYVHARKLLPLLDWAANGKIEFHLEIEPGVSVELAVLFFDSAGKELTNAIRHPCRNVVIDVPAGAVNVRLALRVKGSGQSRIVRFVLGHLPAHSSLQLGRADHLLVTNQYPSNDNLYRNAFVHRRVKGYRELGLRTDVFCLRDVGVTGYHEFEDVDITIGWKEQLRTKLAGHHYRTILVHFLDRSMWDVLKDVIDQVRVIVWVHGSDIQHWERRAFMYASDVERERARAQSEARAALWREVLEHPHPNLHLVFVSRYLAETSLSDLGVNLAPEQYSIIHNFIDGELFHYQPKPPEQRWRMLSIRPYASRVYANDLTVKTILALRGTPEFERMEFRLIGDGPLFAETLAPLEGLPNVQTEQRFLTQAEIAALHREYGVFLVPTRMDSQGVSRDEAMASGLVPLTNAVAAIPEFVDSDCAMVAAPDDVSSMVALLLELVRNPSRFERMSAAAAARVRLQCSADVTVSKEALLINGACFSPAALS